MSYDEHDWEQEEYVESLGQGAEYWEAQYQSSSARIIEEIRGLVEPNPKKELTSYIQVSLTEPEAEVTKRALSMYLQRTPLGGADMSRMAWEVSKEAWDVYSRLVKAGREADRL